MKARLFIIVCSILFSAAVHAGLTASVDRNPVNAGESFSLTLTLDKQSNDDVDTTALEQLFKLLGRSQSTQMQISNGRRSTVSELTLTLLASQPGTYHVPALSWAGDKSEPFDLTVQPAGTHQDAASDKPIFMRAELDKTESVEQAQVILSVRVFYATQIYNHAQFRPLNVDHALIEPLGKESQYQTTIDGRRYGVVEKRYALFPQKPGTLTIPPIGFETEVGSRTRSNSPFDVFNRTEPLYLESQPQILTVKPKPAGASTPWLPAKNLILSADLTPNASRYEAGEPLTWTISVQADGLSKTQLPSLAPATIAGAKLYPDAPLQEQKQAGDRLISKRTEKLAVIPTAAGTVTLPALTVRWFNTDTEREEITTLPARTLTIAAASGAVPAATPLPKPASQPSAPRADASPAPLIVNDAGFWPWLTALSVLGWLVTGGLWFIQTRRVQAPALPSSETSTSPDQRALKKAVIAAAQRNDAKATRQALQRWVQAYAPRSTVEQFCSEQDSPSLQQALNELNYALYQPMPTPWQGDTLIAALQALQYSNRRECQKNRLPALYGI